MALKSSLDHMTLPRQRPMAFRNQGLEVSPVYRREFYLTTDMEAEDSSVPGASSLNHGFAMAGSSTAVSSNGPITTSSGINPAHPTVNHHSISTSTVSATALESNTGTFKYNSTSTRTALTQSHGAAGLNPQSNSGSSRFTTLTQLLGAASVSLQTNSSSTRSSSSISTAAEAVARKALTGGSAVTSLSTRLSSLPSSMNAVITNAVTSSNGMTSSKIALPPPPESSNVHSGDTAAQTASVVIASASSRAGTLVSTNQTSSIPTSTSSTKFVNAVVHSNTTLLGSQAFGSTLLSRSTLLSLVSSSARARSASSTSFLPSLTLANYRSSTPSNSFSTSSNSGVNTLSATAQIAIPITSFSPNNAAAIADGVAIGGGLALLYDKARSISDVSALVASKPDMIKSIETFKSDLKRLSLDLGGSGTSSCSKIKSRSRSRKRSILDRLLNTITSTVCSLIKVQAEIDTIAPVLAVIAADWVVIGGLAEVLTQEEKEEEKEEKEEEEEEEKSQSAEEERASETAKKKTQSTSTPKASVSTVSSTSISRTPIPYVTEICQPYPINIDDSPAADNIALAVAAFELSLFFGSSGSGGSGGGGLIGNSTSSNSINSATGGLTTSTRGVFSNSQSPAVAATPEAFIISASVSAASASEAFLSAVSVSAASVSRASVSAASISSASALRASISAASVSALSVSVASASRASASSASASAASVSRAYVSAASISSASASAASAYRASLSAASLSAASVSAAAASFPTQLSSNNEGSYLCKSVGSNTCTSAYSLYNSSYLYTHYTSYVQTAGGFDGEWLGWGCAAMFTCDTDEAYAKGMTGQQILNAFQYLYSKDDVTICGSVYMGNECHLTVNACDFCESSIPCEALPTELQPPHGDVPCFYNDGTTWPPTRPPETGCGGVMNKRYFC